MMTQNNVAKKILQYKIVYTKSEASHKNPIGIKFLFFFIPTQVIEKAITAIATMTTPTKSNRSSRWQANIDKESNRLAPKENDWNLAGATATTRTRRGGQRCEEEEGSLSNDSEQETESVATESDTDMTDNSKSSSSAKPKATRVILEADPLVETVEKFSICGECQGSVKAELRTVCLASSLKLSCLDKDCSFVYHSLPPAPTSLHSSSGGENLDNFERTTDYAINVL